MPNTYFMLAGEASGDLHAARLITALKQRDETARFVGMGGPKMAAAGMTVAKDLRGMQVVGFWEVAKKYGFFKKVFYELLDRVKSEQPTALICVDYPGFNLRFAKEVKKLGIPVLYYIVPQVWAWKAMRAKSMAQFVDRAFCVFEFELPFFERFGLKTEFVGHPLIDAETEEKPPALKLPPRPKTVSFLPGSRDAEFEHHAPLMIEGFQIAENKIGPLRGLMSLAPAVKRTDWAFHALINNTDRANPLRLPKNFKPAPVIVGPRTEYDACKATLEAIDHTRVSHASLLPAASDFSVVKSGTSTLEAALSGNPMCVVYRASAISYGIAHLLVNIPVFSLVNIVLGRYVVPELLQGDVTPQRIAQEIERGITDARYIETQKRALAELPQKLGGPGASGRAAQGILDFLAGRG
jgi:lipid-A-disaccharide synthase